MSGYLALRKHRIAGPVVIGIALSACIEMLQQFVPTRYCSALDLVSNTIGSALGVGCGILFARIAARRSFSLHGARQADRAALALLFCWAASLLFPFFPVTSLHVYREEVFRFASNSFFDPLTLLSDAACWFVAGRLLRAVVPAASAWLAVSLLLVPAQFFIINRNPLPADFAGALLGFLLFWRLGSKPGAAKACSAGFFALLFVRGLAPFRFVADAAQPFGWLPFGALLTMNWQPGFRILAEKLFYYGAAVWLLREAGLRLRWSIATAALFLLGIEAAQSHIAGRTPEITDPLLAIMAGFAIRALSQRPKSAAVYLPPAPR
jgi:VanZ family protein